MKTTKLKEDQQKIIQISAKDYRRIKDAVILLESCSTTLTGLRCTLLLQDDGTTHIMAPKTAPPKG
jgi:hypothetical protein